MFLSRSGQIGCSASPLKSADVIPSAEILSIPLTLGYFLILGLRCSFDVPVALRANWLFRLTVEISGRHTFRRNSQHSADFGLLSNSRIALLVRCSCRAPGKLVVPPHRGPRKPGMRAARQENDLCRFIARLTFLLFATVCTFLGLEGRVASHSGCRGNVHPVRRILTSEVPKNSVYMLFAQLQKP